MPRVTPTFLVVGAPRCATTSLHYYLDQHPDITMSRIKEPGYFLFDRSSGTPVPLVADDPRIVRKSVSDPQAYRRLFERPGGSATGDVSPLYLFTEASPALAVSANPAIRAVAVLRDPVARAWSHFLSLARHPGDRTPAAFSAAIAAELDLPDSPYAPGTHHLRLGRYDRQLRRWSAALGSGQLHVVDHQRLVDSPEVVLAEICRFLDLDDGFGFDVSIRFNPATQQHAGRARRRLDRVIAPHHPTLKRALPPWLTGRLAHRRARSRAAGAQAALPVPQEVRATLQSYFAADIAAVHRDYGIDLRPQHSLTVS